MDHGPQIWATCARNAGSPAARSSKATNGMKYMAAKKPLGFTKPWENIWKIMETKKSMMHFFESASFIVSIFFAGTVETCVF